MPRLQRIDALPSRAVLVVGALVLLSGCSLALDFGDDPSTRAEVYSLAICVIGVDSSRTVSDPPYPPDHPFGVSRLSTVWRNDCSSELEGMQLEVVEIPDGFYVMNADPGPADGGLGARLTVPTAAYQDGVSTDIDIGEEIQIPVDVHLGSSDPGAAIVLEPWARIPPDAGSLNDF